MALESTYIDRGQLQAALKELDKVADRFADPKWRKKILGQGARLVQNAARNRQKKSKAVHYYYGGGRTKKTRIKIRPGNLKRSIQYLRKLNKTPSAVIGPLRIDSFDTITELGRVNSSSSGYYAHMSQKAYAGAEDFRRHIMEPALQQTTSKIIAHLSKETTQRTKQTTIQLRFWQ